MDVTQRKTRRKKEEQEVLINKDDDDRESDDISIPASKGGKKPRRRHFIWTKNPDDEPFTISLIILTLLSVVTRGWLSTFKKIRVNTCV
jgi:hypothetical protein